MSTLAKNNPLIARLNIAKAWKLARALNPCHSNDPAMQYLIATGAIAAVSYVCFLGGSRISEIDAIVLYFATTYLLAYRSTLGPALWASILSLIGFDLFVTPPVFQFDLTHAFSFSIMLVLILLTSYRTECIRKYTSGLEDMVKERTNELEQSNRMLSEEAEKHRITEDKLRRTVAELGRSNATLSQFARIASHDLQEPLRVIQGYAGLLDSRYKDKLDSNGKEFLDFIVEGTLRMEGLVKGILEHATVSYSTKRFELVEVGMALEDACANLNERIKITNAVVTHDQLPEVLANKVQITQLFQNLIGNALKFQNGEQAPEIHISCKQDGKYYVFCVEDNGIGIERHYQEQIFGMFKRLHSSQDFPGSGLGLAICKAIVDQHKGKIWVESEYGSGARFYFSLPGKQNLISSQKRSSVEQ